MQFRTFVRTPDIFGKRVSVETNFIRLKKNNTSPGIRRVGRVGPEYITAL
jgi:hypothetical protein